jgi:hypothetical protein
MGRQDHHTAGVVSINMIYVYVPWCSSHSRYLVTWALRWCLMRVMACHDMDGTWKCPLNWMNDHIVHCSTSALRSTNILFAIGIFFVVWALLRQLHPSSHHGWFRPVVAFNVTIFPAGYFYTFLYYTDHGSVFFVLLSYLLVLRRWYLLSAMV